MKNFILLSILFITIVITLSNPREIFAQQGVGACCGSGYGQCANGLICDTYVGPVQCPFSAYTCRQGTPQDPAFNLPYYGRNNIPQLGIAGGGTRGVGSIVNTLLPYIFAIAGFALLIYLLMGAITLLSGYGNSEKNALGSKIITRALIGYIILFVSFLLVEVVELILGLRITGMN